jgi:hypothetical protein
LLFAGGLLVMGALALVLGYVARGASQLVRARWAALPAGFPAGLETSPARHRAVTSAAYRRGRR